MPHDPERHSDGTSTRCPSANSSKEPSAGVHAASRPVRRKTTGTLAAAGVADVRVALRATLDGPNASKRMRSSDTFSARNPSYKSRMNADGPQR